MKRAVHLQKNRHQDIRSRKMTKASQQKVVHILHQKKAVAMSIKSLRTPEYRERQTLESQMSNNKQIRTRICQQTKASLNVMLEQPEVEMPR